MRIAYWINWDLASNDGVTKAVKARLECWRDLGHEVKVFGLTRGNHDQIPFDGEFISKPLHKGRSIRELIDRCLAFKPDICNQRLEFFHWELVKLYRSVPTVIELHTLCRKEYLHQMRNSPLKWGARYLIYELSHRYQYGEAAGFVGVTQEILDQNLRGFRNKPSVVVANSVDIFEGREFPANGEDGKSVRPQVVFTGSARCPWHGLDRLKELANSCKGAVDFHVIGPLADDDRASSITHHGPVYGEAFLQKLSQYDVGIGPLAFDRNQMKEACPLKVRDYVKVGMAMAIRHKDPCLPGDAMPDWVFNFDSDRDPLLQADEFVSFCRRWTAKRTPIAEREKLFILKNVEMRRMKFFEGLLRPGKTS